MATMGFIQTQENFEKQTDTNPILVPETFTHAIAFGQTGCGKTSSFIYPNLKNRIEMGHGILVYDYKGKEHLSVKSLAYNMERLDDVVEIGKPWGASINFIQNMDEDELDKFFSLILHHSNDNKFWENSAKALGQTLLSVLKGIEDFAQVYASVANDKIATYETLEFSYPTVRSLESLVTVCKTFESLKQFVKGLTELRSEFKRNVQRFARDLRTREGNTAQAREKLMRLLSAQKRFDKILRDKKDSLHSFGEDSNENLTQNIIGTLIAPITSIAQNKSYNTDSFDIVKALGEGKIVILNVEALSDAMVESLNNSILYELSKRTKSVLRHPVSVFIDEVQRVIDKDADLPIDVFREAKVDLFLATQNSSLLKDKLGDDKFESLMGNLTRKYYFQSSADEEIESEYELEFLESFEYLCSADKYATLHKSKPIFITPEKKMKVEYRYQQKHNILQNYLVKYATKAVIADFDSRLYKGGKLLMIDLKTQKEYVVEALGLEEHTMLEKEVINLLTAHLRRAS